jgi:amino acid permease
MLLSALHTALFSLHHFFDSVGFILATISIVALGLCYALSADILIFCFKTSPYSKTLNDLMRSIMGPVFGFLYDFVFSMFLFLSLIVQILSISENFYTNFGEYVWDWVNVPVAKRTFEHFNFYFCFVLGITLIFVILKRTIGQYRYYALMAFGVILYIVCVCLAQTPLYINDLIEKGNAKYVYINADIKSFLSTYGMILYAFNCTTNFFGVVTNVSNPSVRRLRKIFNRTFTILTILLIAFGTASYLSLGTDLSKGLQLFIFRPKIGETDYFMLVGRSMLILGLYVGIGLTLLPLKAMVFHHLNAEPDAINNFLLTFALIAGPVTISALFPNLSNYLSIAGAFGVTVIVFTFPGVCALKIDYSEKTWVRMFIGFWIVVMTGFGFAGSYFSIVGR